MRRRLVEHVGLVAVLVGCGALPMLAPMAVEGRVGSVAATPLAGGGQARVAQDGVYTDVQATRGERVYRIRCRSCHGATLAGDAAPPLTGEAFLGAWGRQSLADLVTKIQTTMPADVPGQLTRQQAADVVAHMLKVGRFPAGQTELVADEAVLKQIALAAGQTPASAPTAAKTAAQAPVFPPVGNLAQVMRGILFPSSNLIFDVQVHDPGAKPAAAVTSSPDASLTVRFAGIYTGWPLVDYAAVALAESAPLMLTPGRRCENGRPVPVEREDWIKYSLELAEAGKAAYKASQSRNAEAVSDASNQVADACLNCHVAYRDKPGGVAAHCIP